MPGRLSLEQWLSRPGRLPAVTVRAALVTVAVCAAIGGYLAYPGGGDDPPARAAEAIPASRLVGEVPVARAAAPRLRTAAAVPDLRRPVPAAAAPAAEDQAPAAPAEPVVAAAPLLGDGPPQDPVTPAPVAAAPAPPRTPAPARPAPAKPSPSGETFDSSG